MKNKDETDNEKIDQLIKRGEFVTKEIEALYMLRKYRTLKKRYYDDDQYSMKMEEIEGHAKSS